MNMIKKLISIYGLTAFVLAPWYASAQNTIKTQKAGDVTFTVDGGAGWLFGNVTYQIGGDVVYASGESTTYHFPISELKFPLNNAIARIALSGMFEQIVVSASFAHTLTSDAGTMEDSDWSDSYNPKVKTVFSESDSTLDAWNANVGFNYIFFETQGGFRNSLAGGVGCLYESFEWENSNFDQSYPSTPGATHDYYSGVGITYEANLLMPYLALSETMSYKRFNAAATLRLTPWARISDEDDHVYRQIRSKIEADGMAAQFSLQGNLYLTTSVFLFARGEYLYCKADGDSENIVYGPGVNNSSADSVGLQWSIEEKIFISQVTVLAGIGIDL